MLEKVIYLDNASTTRMQDDVVNKMINFYTEDFYNPSSIYSSSQRIRTKVEECRIERHCFGICLKRKTYYN